MNSEIVWYYGEQTDVDTLVYFLQKLQTNCFGGTILNYCGRNYRKSMQKYWWYFWRILPNSYGKIRNVKLYWILEDFFCITLQICWGAFEAILEIRNHTLENLSYFFKIFKAFSFILWKDFCMKFLKKMLKQRKISDYSSSFF